MGLSGSMNYTAPSGSFYATGTLFAGARKYRASVGSSSFFPPSSTTTITQELTVEYFQRIYDSDGNQWTYFTKTEIDDSPTGAEVTPPCDGNFLAGSYSVVKILEIY